MPSFGVLQQAIIEGDEIRVKSEVEQLLAEKVQPAEILSKGLIAGMDVVGGRFRSGEMFLPEVLFSSEIMHQGLDIIKPLLAESGHQSLGRVVIGTVEGDIHDIGKRIVGFLLEGSGFEVIDLGVDIKAAAFAEAVSENKADLLGMSALLTTTMPNMEIVLSLLKEKGLREKVKIIIGGAPVSQQFADSIGADGYAPEASSAVELAKKLLAV